MKHSQPFFKLFALALFSVFIFALNMGCGEGGKEKETGTITEEKELDPKYFSEANPGKWEDVASGHRAIIEIFNVGQEKRITINSGFPNRPDHYTEVIILTDHMHREIGSVGIKKGEEPQATFIMPRDYRSKLYAIVKCNLHDMWEHPIIFD